MKKAVESTLAGRECSYNLSVLLPLNRGLPLLSEIFNVSQKTEVVRLIMAGRCKWCHARLMRNIYCGQMMVMQRMVRSMSV